MSYEEREDLAVFLALVEYMRRQSIEIIEKSASSAQKRPLREAVASSALALKAALEDVERWAGPGP